jgi:2'-5' RNA ligase
MKRLFIGIPMPCETTRSKVRSWQTDPGLNLNRLAWTPYPNWHITLAFLGAVPESSVALLSQIIVSAFNDCPAYTTALSGMGIFPPTGKPNVLWLGLESLQPLLPAYQKLTSLLLQNNFALDPKPLKAHLTIARIKSLQNPEPFYSLIKNHQHTFFERITISQISLYESLSSPSGVIYLPLYEQIFGK